MKSDFVNIGVISKGRMMESAQKIFKKNKLKIYKKNQYSHVYILDKVNKPAIAAKISGIKNIIGPGFGNQKKWLTTENILKDTDFNLSYSEQSQKLLKLHNINLSSLWLKKNLREIIFSIVYFLFWGYQRE